MSEMLHCQHCGQTIGVYEPLIALIMGRAYETSRAATDHPGGLPEAFYHSTCFELAHVPARSRREPRPLNGTSSST